MRTVDPEELDSLREKVREDFGFQVRFTHFPIVGLCPRCAANDDGRAADPEHEHSHGDHVHSHAHAH